MPGSAGLSFREIRKLEAVHEYGEGMISYNTLFQGVYLVSEKGYVIYSLTTNLAILKDYAKSYIMYCIIVTSTR